MCFVSLKRDRFGHHGKGKGRLGEGVASYYVYSKFGSILDIRCGVWFVSLKKGYEASKRTECRKNRECVKTRDRIP